MSALDGPKRVNRYALWHYMVDLVSKGKLQFGGVPASTMANWLAVKRFAWESCKEHGIVPTQAISIVREATALIMTADEGDIAEMKLLNGDELSTRRTQFISAQRRPGAGAALVAEPFSGSKWRLWVGACFGMPQPTPFRLTK